MARRVLMPDEEPKKAAPVEEDIRNDDLEYNPQAVEAIEPKSAKAWLNLLQESEDAFEQWNAHCDRIDKQYANLERLSSMAPRQRVPDVLGQLRGDQAEHLCQAADAGGGAEIQGPQAGLSGRGEVAERCATGVV